MSDEVLITKRSTEVKGFFSQANAATDMLDYIGRQIRIPFEGRIFIDDKELSMRLSLHRRTLHNYRDANRIPYYKIGSKVIYDIGEIEQLLEDHYHPKY